MHGIRHPAPPGMSVSTSKGMNSLKAWPDFEASAPDIAGLGRKLLNSGGKVLLATVRTDGAPRLHPICPALTRHGLFAVIIMKTPKYGDLIRDGRYMLHTAPAAGDAEFAAEGVARKIGEAGTLSRAAAETGVAVPAGDALFELMIESAFGVLYQPGPDGLAVPMCRRWRAEAAA
jgi:hypothetical protein